VSTRRIIIVGLFVLVASSMAMAQSEPSGKTLASTLEVYVFPTEAQTTEQQSMDEVACYEWAVEQTGTDPFDLKKQAEEQKTQAEKNLASADQAEKDAQKAGSGATAGGAVKGAVVGGLIGTATGDARKGAAIGAGAGAVAGRRRGKQAQAQAGGQAEEQKKQAEKQAAENKEATQEQADNFKKAFSVCLEAKNYMVK
jgi:outer membrane lipoprotein SlyB